jgi:membrane protein YdbS with pleckstrin-like domain
MAAKRFKSKIDRWIMVLLVVVIVTQIWAISTAASQAGEPLVTTGLILVGIAVVALMLWLIIGTHYTVDRGTLRIVSGPFRWKVPIDQISSVEATKSPLSSPALSLDRLRVRYGKNRRILISPADRVGFLKAIGHELKS